MNVLKILSIGAGKPESHEEINILQEITKKFDYDTVVRLFLDKSYFIPPGNREETIYKFEDYVKRLECYKRADVSFEPLSEEYFYSNCYATEFMQRTRVKFDVVILNRVLEHIPKDEVLYFIYLLSTITNPGKRAISICGDRQKQGIISVIVPDYKLLANMLLNEEVGSPNFDKHNILLTSELLNEVSDPHASIWTAERLEYFFEYENRFEVTNITRFFKFDKRDIYIHALIQKT
jgi:hypothetical protein